MLMVSFAAVQRMQEEFWDTQVASFGMVAVLSVAAPPARVKHSQSSNVTQCCYVFEVPKAGLTVALSML
jgi:hypothetical protein